ncbi:MAG: hypothetical protein E7350_01770 [Clostridiales bacterium]|nr:hypothetical protein [Clostridiales bacterium]
MKEIVFGNLNFNIVDSYKVMKSIIDNKKEIYLFNNFLSKAVVYRTLLGAEIEFEIDNQDKSTLTKIDEILFQEYGKPDYIAKGTLKVWRVKGCYIVHGMIEKHYQVHTHIIKVCFKKPFCFMVNYSKYDKYFSMFSKISRKWGLELADDLVVSRRKISVSMDTKNFSYYIYLSRNKFAFYSSEKTEEAEGTRLVPSWNCKGKYKTIQKLHDELYSFFYYLEEYDLSLNKQSDLAVDLFA